MLSSVITLFETLKTIGYYSIILSYNTGKIIVTGLLTSLELLHKLYHTLWTVLVILQEDLVIFLIDVWNRIVLVLHEAYNFSEYINETIVSIFIGLKCLIWGVSSAIVTLFQTIITIISKVVSNFGTLLAAIKHLVVLFGSGVWFAITIVPIFIVYICMMTTYYIGRAFEELKTFSCMLLTQTINGIKDIITFVTDVPLESLAGLIICSCLVYAIVVFHIALYSTLCRFARHTLATVNRNVNRLRTALIRRRNPRVVHIEVRNAPVDSDTSGSGSELAPEDLEPLEPLQTSSEGWKTKRQRNKELMEGDDRLCVICMERNKCILSMPCRHLCTCSECNNILRTYHRNCPICRCYVNYTIHVY